MGFSGKACADFRGISHVFAIQLMAERKGPAGGVTHRENAPEIASWFEAFRECVRTCVTRLTAKVLRALYGLRTQFRIAVELSSPSPGRLPAGSYQSSGTTWLQTNNAHALRSRDASRGSEGCSIGEVAFCACSPGADEGRAVPRHTVRRRIETPHYLMRLGMQPSR